MTELLSLHEQSSAPRPTIAGFDVLEVVEVEVYHLPFLLLQIKPAAPWTESSLPPATSSPGIPHTAASPWRS